MTSWARLQIPFVPMPHPFARQFLTITAWTCQWEKFTDIWKTKSGLKDTVATNVEQLFSTVTIPGQFVKEDMTFAGADFDITVKAEAVQTENIDITGVNGSCDAEKTFNKINWIAFEEYPA